MMIIHRVNYRALSVDRTFLSGVYMCFLLVFVCCLCFSQVFDYGACAGGHALHDNLDFDILLFFEDDGG